MVKTRNFEDCPFNSFFPEDEYPENYPKDWENLLFVHLYL